MRRSRSLDAAGGLGDGAGCLDGNIGDAVLVAVEEVAGPHHETADLDGLADVDQVVVGVGDEDAGGKGVEGHGLHLGEVADAAVGDGADAAERLEDVAVDLAPEGADGLGVVHVLDDEHLGAGRRGDMLPQLGDAGSGLGTRRHAGADDRGGRIRDHGPKAREAALDLRPHEALGAGPQVERLDGVANGGAGDLPERLELLGGEGVVSHRRGSSVAQSGLGEAVAQLG